MESGKVGNEGVQQSSLGESPIGLLEEESIIFQIRHTLADDYSLCLPFLQGFSYLDMSRIRTRKHQMLFSDSLSWRSSRRAYVVLPRTL